jgi:flagellar hook-basal body complex protein FliE
MALPALTSVAAGVPVVSTGVPAGRPASTPSSGTTGAGSSTFASTLGSLVEGVERSTAQANAAVGGMLDKSVDVHDAMIALQRSELSLQLVVQVRNKLVQAYQDIMRMPI